jgi:hypothetical protein
MLENHAKVDGCTDDAQQCAGCKSKISKWKFLERLVKTSIEYKASLITASLAGGLKAAC